MASLASLAQFSPEQRIAFDKFKNGENLFITGAGGTGKSKLIQEMVKYSNNIGKNIQVCALTGCAAVLLECCNAITIHSFSAIGYMNTTDDKILDKVYKNFKAKKLWKITDILIVDEVSMMSKRMFELLEKIGRMLRNKKGYFGGLQVIFTGDFFQLPPISDDGEKETPFCFESEHWFDVFLPENHIELIHIFRQNDQLYVDILTKVRRGIMDDESVDVLKMCINRPVDNAHAITQLFPLKNKVDTINRMMFSKIKESVVDFTLTIDFNARNYIGDMKPIEQNVIDRCNDVPDEFKSREVEKMLTSNNLVRNLELKIGSVVMCTKNISVESGICNGSQGIIEEFQPDGPVVRFNNGIKEVINKTAFQSSEYPTIVVYQVPICLAWAMTIHKIQGITLDSAMIDVGNSVFEYGQTYVALSRIKSLDGLYLINFDAKKIKANPKVIEFYQHMKDTRERAQSVLLPPQVQTVGGKTNRCLSAKEAAANAAIQRNMSSFFMPKSKPDDKSVKKEKEYDDECPICLNKYKNAYTTQCGHKYCMGCLTKHLQLKKQLECPYCRQKITEIIPEIILNNNTN
jgi:ATP-dependent DNA helicase PIF1